MKTQHSTDGNIDTNIEQNRGLVVLVHGIWMTGLELSLLAYRLRRAGFATERFFYHSLFSTPAESAARLYRFLQKRPSGTVHLVAHSLGGIVLLHLFDRYNNLPLGRVVLMGSPVLGSGVARRLHASGLTRVMLGRSAEQGLLGGAPGWKGGRDLGVITGSAGIGVGSMVGGFKGPGDGTVAVAETLLPGAGDYCQIPTSHMGMVVSSSVADEVIEFLQNSRFSGSHAVSPAKNGPEMCSDDPRE